MQFEFDNIPVPEEKLKHTVTESLTLVKKHHCKKKRGIITTFAATAAIVILGAVFISNPVLAAKIPVIGDIFKKVQDNQRYPGNFDEVAAPAAGPNSCSSNGYTLTLSEIYCDTQEFDFLTPPDTYESFEWPGEEYEWTPLEMQGKYEDDHTFIGSFRIDFNLYPIVLAERIPEQFHWKLDINKLQLPVQMESKDIDFTWVENKLINGEWNFENDITVDTSNTAITEINDAAPNGNILTTLTLTPYEGILDSIYDETKVQPGYEKYDSLGSVMLDADNQRISDKVGMFSTAGYNLSEITVYYFPIVTDEEYAATQEKINAESGTQGLREYLESISIHKTVIQPNQP